MYLLVVTGLSGAGKSQALKRFEDMGYFCVDNLPCEMLMGFAQLCQNAVPPVDRAAVVIDSRESVFHFDICAKLSKLADNGVTVHILYLDARDEILERRFKETRRPHPLSGDVRKGIQAERELLAPLRDRANDIIDTSDLKPLELSREVERRMHLEDAPFTLDIMSFGYKRGVPFEADIVLDARFLPNPFYEPALRQLSGADAPVRDFVLGDPDAILFLEGVEHMLVRLIPRFKEQGKRRLMVAFGCTGGRHRSVCMAQALYDRMGANGAATIAHRDTAIEAGDVQKRLEGRE
ncbi:MAG: RNase adapter RapZ [Christensenellaceae bacterium]|nr:RNase adapter RapZ [Christensenellaceae bacterium]